MDEFKDFFKDLRDRVSNPFIGSFIISWLLTNWPITVAIVFYSQKEIEADGFRTYYQLIKFHGNWIDSFFRPLIYALFYVAASPWAKSFIKLYNADLKAQNEADIMDKTKDKPVNLKKYMRLLDALKKEQERLSELENMDKDIKAELIETGFKLSAETDRAKNAMLENQRLTAQISQITEAQNGQFLNGKWEAVTDNQSDKKQIWEFRDGNLSIDSVTNYVVLTLLTNITDRKIAISLVPFKTNMETPLGNFPKLFFSISKDDQNLYPSEPGMIYKFSLTKLPQ